MGIPRFQARGRTRCHKYLILGRSSASGFHTLSFTSVECITVHADVQTDGGAQTTGLVASVSAGDQLLWAPERSPAGSLPTAKQLCLPGPAGAQGGWAGPPGAWGLSPGGLTLTTLHVLLADLWSGSSWTDCILRGWTFLQPSPPSRQLTHCPLLRSRSPGMRAGGCSPASCGPFSHWRRTGHHTDATRTGGTVVAWASGQVGRPHTGRLPPSQRGHHLARGALSPGQSCSCRGCVTHGCTSHVTRCCPLRR